MKNQWNILFLAKEAYAKCIQGICNQYGINQMEFSILLLLVGDESLNTAQKVVNTYHLSKSHVSTSLHSLENKGYVKRFSEGKKRKNISLRVTDPGLEVAEVGREALGRLQSEIFYGLSEKEIKIIETSIDTIKRNLQSFINNK